jgi:TPP-dependent indolepyruvate ferredoxin oxidoreductase alpha subunit
LGFYLFKITAYRNQAARPKRILTLKKHLQYSEKYDTPVLFRMTTRVAHSKEDILIGERVDVPIQRSSF